MLTVSHLAFSYDRISIAWDETIDIAFMIKLSSVSSGVEIEVESWCSGYNYCTGSFNYVWTHVLRRFKPCSRYVGVSRLWGSLSMVPVGKKVKRYSSVNRTTETIHHYHNHHHHQQLQKLAFAQAQKKLLGKRTTLKCVSRNFES